MHAKIRLNALIPAYTLLNMCEEIYQFLSDI